MYDWNLWSLVTLDATCKAIELASLGAFVTRLWSKEFIDLRILDIPCDKCGYSKGEKRVFITISEDTSTITLFTWISCIASTAHQSELSSASKGEVVGQKARLLWNKGIPSEFLTNHAAPEFRVGLIQDEATLHFNVPAGGFTHRAWGWQFEDVLMELCGGKIWKFIQVEASSEALAKIKEPDQCICSKTKALRAFQICQRIQGKERMDPFSMEGFLLTDSRW